MGFAAPLAPRIDLISVCAVCSFQELVIVMELLHVSVVSEKNPAIPPVEGDLRFEV
jgi:hypothetical protein